MAATTTSILVVEDDPALRTILVDVLEWEGYSVLCAENGAQALELVERECPSLMLLDLRLPVLDGWELARRVRARGNRIPIVVMTAAQDARVCASAIGSSAYLAKPFTVDEIIDAVRRVEAAASNNLSDEPPYLPPWMA